MTNDDRKRPEILTDSMGAATRNANQQRLHAALVDAARAIRATRDRIDTPTAETAAMLDRCEALLQGAREAARAKSRLVAYDCLYQVERELVATMDETERRAALAVYRAESSAMLVPWRREAARALAGGDDGVPTVATLQTLMGNVHAARRQQHYRVELVRRQINALAVPLIVAILFCSGWALAGGFEWVLHDDVEATLAMMLVNGMLFGYFGGLLSVVFGLLRPEVAVQANELRGGWTLTIVRPFVGAAVAIPIAFFLQSGLVNLGNVTPAFDLALCFIGGFTERWFSAQFDRIAGSTDR